MHTVSDMFLSEHSALRDDTGIERTARAGRDLTMAHLSNETLMAENELLIW